MPQVQPIKLNKEERLQVPQPKNAPFLFLPRNECMLTVSGGGKSVAHIRTLMDSDKLGGMFDRYEMISPNIFVDTQYESLIECAENHRTEERYLLPRGV